VLHVQLFFDNRLKDIHLAEIYKEAIRLDIWKYAFLIRKNDLEKLIESYRMKGNVCVFFHGAKRLFVPVY
jgi:hypothetical protein